MIESSTQISTEVLLQAFEHMATAKTMTELYESNFKQVSKYVHATSRGHEAIQIAIGMQLKEEDYAWLYYRDDATLLSMGLRPYELMLQLLAKKDDPFTGGRSYYSHPALKRDGFPKIPHQSSATGMQAIPATGAALGIQYKELTGITKSDEHPSLVYCSLGDACVTEGEVAEAFQMAALKQVPILYIVQDNGWDISASAAETRAQDANEYIKGFNGIETTTIDGSDFVESYIMIQKAINYVREKRKPGLVHAKVPLLNHHTSGVRMEWYRDDLEDHKKRDPYPKLRNQLLEAGVSEKKLQAIEKKVKAVVEADFKEALAAPNPKPEDLFTHDFAPYELAEEKGKRAPENGQEAAMVDHALFAIKELMKKHPECLVYGQDVGHRLGGVFRETATLADIFGKSRVFNTPIQEAFIIGSTVGMSAIGLKPIVEVQFADYMWPGLNQLFTEVSRSNYLSNGKWPINSIIRVPIGAYGSGGPYHSSSIETVVANIRGVKIAYPSTGADLKGLMKAAFYDPNPVVIFEHKGLYWSKIPGTEAAKTIEPDEDYMIPFGKARMVQSANDAEVEKGNSISIICYGMGVYWAQQAAKKFPGQVEIIDLRTLYPMDVEAVFNSVQNHGKALLITEEPLNNSLIQSLAGRIQEACFQYLDAPIMTIGAENMPAIPLNEILEKTMLPSAEKVAKKIEELLNY